MDSAIVQYAHPLLVDATIFLKALQSSTPKTSQFVDQNLIEVFNKILNEMQTIVVAASDFIVETDNTKLIKENEISSIYRTLHCSKCRQHVGETSCEALFHVQTCESKTVRAEKNAKPKVVGRKEEIKESVMPKKLKWFLSQDMTGFFDKSLAIAETLKRVPEHDTVTNELAAIVKPLFPEKSVTLYKFGSRINGTGTGESDLDIFVDIGQCFNNFENRSSAETDDKFAKVRKALLQKTHLWKHMVAIDKARVPIIRVTHASAHIECDIGFSNSLGYCNTVLLEYLFELQPIARYMCIYLKKWLQRSKLPKYSSYSISLMVIYYLQLNEYLPSIQSLQTDMETSVRVGPWIANYNKKTRAELNIPLVDASPANCLKFLKLFFELYSIFNYEVYAVSPFLGSRVQISNLEQEMPERYHKFVASCGPDARLDVKKAIMVVQDPLQLSHNVTHNIPKAYLKALTDYFAQTAVIIEPVVSRS